MHKNRWVLSALYVIISFSLLNGQELSEAFMPSEVCIKNTKQFWIKSEHALGKEFLIKIFLPKNYFESGNTKYPVVYLTDGDGIFGAATEISYFVHFGNPSIVLVGICYGSWKLVLRNGVKILVRIKIRME